MAVTIIAEAGLNHNGCLASALELVDLAARAGADVVKFQMRTPELSTPRAEWDRPRVPPWGGPAIPYIDYRRGIEFGAGEYQTLDHYCRGLGLRWTASVWDGPALDRLLLFDVPFIKIPSARLTDDALLAAAARSGRPVLLSCGMSDEAEVDRAVGLIAGAHGASLLHTNSAYPAADAEQNLSLIPRMRERYGMPVGFSSHAVSPFVPLAAVSRWGAAVVEAHLTKDRALPGSDHAASLEPHGLELLAREVRRLDVLGGDGQRRVWDSERAARAKLRGDP